MPKEKRLVGVTAGAGPCGGKEPDQALTGAFIEAAKCLPSTHAKELGTLQEYTRRSGDDYVLDCFWSAWDAFLNSRNYEDAIVRAIKFGHDTDTTAAVAGGLAGAHFGVGSIPSSWLAEMRGKEIVDPLVEELIEIETAGIGMRGSS